MLNTLSALACALLLLVACAQASVTTSQCSSMGGAKVGSSCYKAYSSPASWFTARSTCRSLEGGWHLVSLSSSTEHSQVNGFVSGQYWIGLTNLPFKSSSFVYTNGAAVAHLPWASSEPSSGGAVFNQRCVRTTYPGSNFADDNCESSFQYVCETHVQDNPNFSARECTDAGGFLSSSSSRCFLLDDTVRTFQASMDYCRSIRMEMASLSTLAEFNTITANVPSGFTGSAGYWLAITNAASIEDEFVFENIDGTGVGFTLPFDTLRPIKSLWHNFLLLRPSLKLDNEAYQDSFRVACAAPVTSQSGQRASVTSAECSSSGGTSATFSGYGWCYRGFTTFLSWNAARTFCRDLGPGWDLPAINSASESIWLEANMRPGGSGVHVGYTDQQLEGTWMPVNGYYDGFTYWDTAGSQPNNGGAGEHCALLGFGPEETQWHDIDCSSTGADIVCQSRREDSATAPTSSACTAAGGFVYEDRCYRTLTGSYTYKLAMQACWNIGMDVAAINTAAQYAALEAGVSSSTLWTQLNDIGSEGTFYNYDGSPTPPSLNWASGEPSNSNSLEHGVNMNFGGAHTLNDEALSSTTNGVVCQSMLRFDQVNPTFLSVSVTSSLANPAFATTGTLITLLMDASEPLQSATLQVYSGVSGQVWGVSVVNYGGNRYRGQYTVQADDPEMTLPFTFTATDLMGNVASTTTATSGGVYVDKTLPGISSVSILSNNAASTRATATNQITLTFTTSEVVTTASVTFLIAAAQQGTVTASNTGGNNWQAQYIVQNDDPDGIVTITVSATNQAGLTGVTSTINSGSVTVDLTPPSFSAVSIQSNNPNSAWATTTNQITLTFTTSEASTSASVKLFPSTAQEATVTASNTGGNNWQAQYIVQNDDPEGIVTISVSATDPTGNSGTTSTISTGSVTIDLTPPSFSAVSILSNNSDSTRATTNDQITLTFTTNEVATAASVTLFPSTAQEATATASNTGGNNWQAQYIVQNDDPESIVTITVSATNQAGLTDTTSTINSGSVTIDLTSPSFSAVSILSNNSDTAWATTNDEITLAFTTSEVATAASVMLFPSTAQEATVTASNTGSNNWQAQYIVQNDDPEGIVTISVSATDPTGNSGTTSTINSGSVTIDLTPPSFSGVAILSNNSDTAWATTTDQITLTFVTNEVATAASVTLFPSTAQEATVTASNTGGNNWQAQYIIQNDDPEGIVTISVSATNQAGLTDTTSTINSGSVTVDLTPPSFSAVSILSNNSASTRATATDQITLTFTTNEVATAASVTLFPSTAQEATVTASNTGGNNWQAQYIVQADDPEGIVTISVSATNQAGLTDTTSTINSGSVTIDLTPPSFSAVSIQSNNSDTAWATATDEITLTFTTSEASTSASVTLFPSTAQEATVTASNTGGNNWQAQYIVEPGDPEGIVAISVSATDPTGNSGATSTIDTGSVTIDLTPPSFSSVSILSNNSDTAWATTNDQITFTFATNEVATAASVTLFPSTAQEATVTASNTGGNNWQAQYIVQNDDPEGIVTISVSATNQAGLTDTTSTINSGSVTIDLTAPSFSAVSILSNNSDSTRATTTDQITLTFATNEVATAASVTLFPSTAQEATVTASNTGGNNWQAQYVVQADDPEGIVAISVSATNQAGLTDTTSTIDSGSVTIDLTAPSFSAVSILSNNSDTAWATTNDQITFAFATSEVATSAFVTLFPSTAQEATVTASNTGGNNWQAQYIVQNDDPEGIVAISVSATDPTGNSGATSTINSGSVTIDLTPPSFSAVSILSNNSDTAWATTNDQITLTFTTNEVATAASVTLFPSTAQEATVTASNTGGNNWQAQYTVQNDDPEGLILITVSATNQAGLTDTTSTIDSGSVTIDLTAPSFSAVSILSNNSDTAWATTNDQITLTFTTSEVATSASVTLFPSTAQEATVAASNTGGNNWQAQYIVQNDDPEGLTLITVSATNQAGLINTTSTINTGSVTIDLTPPSFSAVSIQSNNQDTAWATTNDEITFTFTTSEVATSASVTLFPSTAQEATVTASNTGGNNWQAQYIIQNDDPEGVTLITVSATNQAGLINTTSTINTGSVTIDLTAPFFSAVSILSNNQDTAWATTNDEITFTFTTNEVVTSASVTLFPSTAQEATVTASNTGNNTFWQAQYTIQNDDPEGVTLITVSATNQAGLTGTTSTINSGSVTIDLTPPSFSSVSVSPEVLLDGSSVTVSTEISDAVAEVGNVTVNIGFDTGASEELFVWEVVMAEMTELPSFGDQAFAYSTQITDAMAYGTLRIRIAARDLAGNEIVAGSVTDGTASFHVVPRVAVVKPTATSFVGILNDAEQGPIERSWSVTSEGALPGAHLGVQFDFVRLADHPLCEIESVALYNGHPDSSDPFVKLCGGALDESLSPPQWRYHDSTGRFYSYDSLLETERSVVWMVHSRSNPVTKRVIRYKAGDVPEDFEGFLAGLEVFAPRPTVANDPGTLYAATSFPFSWSVNQHNVFATPEGTEPLYVHVTSTEGQPLPTFLTWLWNDDSGSGVLASAAPTVPPEAAGSFDLLLTATNAFNYTVELVVELVVLDGSNDPDTTSTLQCEFDVLFPGNTSSVLNTTESASTTELSPFVCFLEARASGEGIMTAASKFGLAIDSGEGSISVLRPDGCDDTAPYCSRFAFTFFPPSQGSVTSVTALTPSAGPVAVQLTSIAEADLTSSVVCDLVALAKPQQELACELQVKREGLPILAMFSAEQGAFLPATAVRLPSTEPALVVDAHGFPTTGTQIGRSFAFNVTMPLEPIVVTISAATGTAVQREVQIETQPDNTSSIECQSGFIAAGMQISCILTSRRLGEPAFVQREYFALSELSGLGSVTQLQPAFGSRFAFSFQSSEQTGNATLLATGVAVSGGVSKLVSVSAAPDGTSTIECLPGAVRVQRTIVCSITPRIAGTQARVVYEAFVPRVFPKRDHTVSPLRTTSAGASQDPLPPGTRANRFYFTITAGTQSVSLNVDDGVSETVLVLVTQDPDPTSTVQCPEQATTNASIVCAIRTRRSTELVFAYPNALQLRVSGIGDSVRLFPARSITGSLTEPANAFLVDVSILPFSTAFERTGVLNVELVIEVIDSSDAVPVDPAETSVVVYDFPDESTELSCRTAAVTAGVWLPCKVEFRRLGRSVHTLTRFARAVIVSGESVVHSTELTPQEDGVRMRFAVNVEFAFAEADVWIEFDLGASGFTQARSNVVTLTSLPSGSTRLWGNSYTVQPALSESTVTSIPTTPLVTPLQFTQKTLRSALARENILSLFNFELPEGLNVSEPTSYTGFERLRSLACGASLCVCASETGSVFSWGTATSSNVRGHSHPEGEADIVGNVTLAQLKVHGDDDVMMTDMVSVSTLLSGAGSLAVNVQGTMYGWGPLFSTGVRVRRLSTGVLKCSPEGLFFLCVTRDTTEASNNVSVVTFGPQSAASALGRSGPATEPTRIDVSVSSAVQVISLVAGPGYGVVLVRDGGASKLWSWGAPLSTTHLPAGTKPQLIDPAALGLPVSDRVVQLDGGSTLLAAVTQLGKLYVCELYEKQFVASATERLHRFVEVTEVQRLGSGGVPVLQPVSGIVFKQVSVGYPVATALAEDTSVWQWTAPIVDPQSLVGDGDFASGNVVQDPGFVYEVPTAKAIATGLSPVSVYSSFVQIVGLQPPIVEVSSANVVGVCGATSVRCNSLAEAADVFRISGTVFELADGRHVLDVPLAISMKSIVLRSRSSDAAATVIECPVGQRCFDFTGAESVAIQHVTLDSSQAGTWPAKGGCLVVTAAQQMVLSGVRFQGCRADVGGAVYTSGRLALIESSVVSATAERGGAIAAVAEDSSLVSVRVINSTLTNCHTEGASVTAAGGSLYAAGCPVQLERTTIASSHAMNGGGGAIALIQDASLDMLHSTIHRASASGSGGALYAAASTVTMSHASVNDTTSVGSGGGIFVEFCRTTLTDVTVSRSTATGAASSGGGVFCRSADGSMQLTRSQFESNGASRGGGALALSFCATTATELEVRDCEAASGGGVMIRDESTLDAVGLVVERNRADTGAGLYLASSEQSTLEGAVVRDNVAQGRGGGAFVTDLNNAVWRASSMDTNSAQAGGAMFFTDVTAQFASEGLSTTGNTRQQFASAAVQLDAEVVLPGGYVSTSGARFTEPVVFRLLDVYGELVSGDDKSSVTVNGLDGADLVGSTLAPVNGGRALFSGELNFGIRGEPGQVLQYEARASVDDVGELSAGPFAAQVRQCVPGEHVVNRECVLCAPGEFSTSGSATACTSCVAGTANPVSGASSCATCPAGRFAQQHSEECFECKAEARVVAPNPGMGACVPCPENAVSFNGTECKCNALFYELADSELCRGCPEGGDCSAVGTEQLSMLPLEGWWPALGARNLEFIECVNDACLGKEVAEQYGRRCDLGFRDDGHLCTECADGYGRAAGYQCQECLSPEAERVRLGIVLSLVGLLTARTAHETLKDAAESSGSIIKLVLSGLQLNAAAAQVQFSMPQPANSVMGNVELVVNAGSILLTGDCLVDKKPIAVLGVMVVALPIVSLLAAVVVLLPIMLYHWCALRRANQATKWRRDAKELITIVAVVVLFLIHPTLSRSVFSMFACKRLGTAADDKFWTVDMSERCWSGEHLWWLLATGVPALVVYVIGIPLLGIYALARHHSRMGEHQVGAWFMFLFKGYKDETYWWEGVVTARKLAVVCTMSIFADDVQLQVLVTVLVVFAAIVLHVHFRPLHHPLMDLLEFVSLITSLLTFWLLQLDTVDSVGSDTHSVIGWLIVLANLVFVLCALVLMAFMAYTIRRLKAKFRKENGLPSSSDEERDSGTEHGGSSRTLAGRVTETMVMSSSDWDMTRRIEAATTPAKQSWMEDNQQVELAVMPRASGSAAEGAEEVDDADDVEDDEAAAVEKEEEDLAATKEKEVAMKKLVVSAFTASILGPASAPSESAATAGRTSSRSRSRSRSNKRGKDAVRSKSRPPTSRRRGPIAPGKMLAMSDTEPEDDEERSTAPVVVRSFTTRSKRPDWGSGYI